MALLLALSFTGFVGSAVAAMPVTAASPQRVEAQRAPDAQAPEDLRLYVISESGETTEYPMENAVAGLYTVQHVKITKTDKLQVRDKSDGKNYTGNDGANVDTNNHSTNIWLDQYNVTTESNAKVSLSNLEPGNYQINYVFGGFNLSNANFLTYTKEREIIIDPLLRVTYGDKTDVMFYNYLKQRHESVVTVAPGETLHFVDGSGSRFCATADYVLDIAEDNMSEEIPMQCLKDNAAVAPSLTVATPGTYEIYVNYTESGSTTLKVTRMAYPDKLYLCFSAIEGEHDKYPTWVELTRTETDGVYVTTPGSAHSEGDAINRFYNAETGNITLHNGDAFFITGDINIVYNKDKGYDFNYALNLYGSSYQNTGNVAFRPGRKTQALTVANQPNGNWTQICHWTANGIGEQNSYPFTLNIRDRAASYVTWGKDFQGDDYYLFSSLMKTSEDNTDKYRFTYHPTTGLYTLDLDELYGSFWIADNKWGNRGNGEYFTSYKGAAQIHNPGTPYPMWSEWDRHTGGNQADNKAAIEDTGCWLDAPSFADRLYCVGGDRRFVPYYAYKNVNLVFDPVSARLWVNVQPKDTEGATGENVVPDPEEGQIPLYIVFVERTASDENPLAVKEVRPMYLSVYKTQGSVINRNFYTSSFSGDKFDIFPACNTRTMLEKDEFNPVVYTPTYFFFSENPDITNTQLNEIYKQTIYYGCRDKKKQYTITSVSRFLSNGISDVRWNTSIGIRPLSDDDTFDFAYSAGAEMKRFIPNVVSPTTPQSAMERAQESTSAIYPIMAGAEAGEYIVHFDRVINEITLFHKLENRLYLVFDNAAIIGDNADDSRGRLGEGDVIEMELDPNHPGTYVARNVVFKPTRNSTQTHFFFSGQAMDRAYETYVDDDMRIFDTRNSYEAILTHSRNFGSRVEDRIGEDQQIIFPENSDMSNSYSADQTAQYMFMPEITPTQVMRRAGSVNELPNSVRAGFDYYVAEPTEGKNYTYNVYFTMPGYVDPNGNLVPAHNSESVGADEQVVPDENVTRDASAETGVVNFEDGRVTLERKGIMTGIGEIEHVGVQVVAGKGTLAVTGASEVTVYDAAGHVAAASAGDATFELEPGVYIVNADGCITKSIVK